MLTWHPVGAAAALSGPWLGSGWGCRTPEPRCDAHPKGHSSTGWLAWMTWMTSTHRRMEVPAHRGLCLAIASAVDPAMPFPRLSVFCLYLPSRPPASFVHCPIVMLSAMTIASVCTASPIPTEHSRFSCCPRLRACSRATPMMQPSVSAEDAEEGNGGGSCERVQQRTRIGLFQVSNNLREARDERSSIPAPPHPSEARCNALQYPGPPIQSW